MSWNYNYGAFSKVKAESTYDAAMDLLKDPDEVLAASFTVFTSALWFYMTPQTPKPSMHEVATEYWVPNDKDTAEGFVAGFGATINIINGDLECGKGYETAQGAYRGKFFGEFLDYFELPAEDASTLTCGGQKIKWATGGYADVVAYFED